MLFRATLLASLCLFLLFTGCAQRETDIGIDAIVGQLSDTFLVATATATASADFDPQFSNGYGPSLQVGEARGLLAFSAIRFNLPAGLPDSAVLDTVRLRLHTNRVWPSGGGSSLRVRIRSIADVWTEDSILVRCMANREEYEIVDSLLISPINDLFYWDVPVSLWERWRTGDSSALGLLFEPQDTGRFLEFYSAEPRGTDADLPVQLQVRGTRWDSTDSGWNDTTLFVNLTPIADAYAVIDRTPRQSDKLMIMQGGARRAALHFSLDSLSSRFMRAVNRAELHLFADTLDPAVIGYSDQNVLFSHGFMNDTLWIANPTVTDSFHMGYESGAVGTWDATSSEYVLDVSGAVANWVANPAGNGGLQIFADDENSFLSRQVFYNHLAETDKKPKLIIWYTESSY